jgi:hypothetical protein
VRVTRSSFPDDPDPIRRAPPPLSEQLAGTMFSPGSFPTAPPVTTAEQRSLEIEGSLDEAYTDWLDNGGGRTIVTRLLERALKMYHAGATRIGVKDLVERERWERKLHINNLFTSRIARTLIDERPELKPLIQIRRLQSAGGISE